ncbi:MAG: hypothetical protein IPP19_03085 [Verrucomicrobia bacterium]|nr:hypothetical protein [Verrucomicrobiota bacterium]
MNYYILDCFDSGDDNTETDAGIDREWYDHTYWDGAWMHHPPSLPMRGEFDPGREWDTVGVGIPRALYLGAFSTFFRKDLLDAVLEAGVDNLDYYPAVLKDFRRPGNIEIHDYFAVNVLGLVYCLDQKKSEMMGLTDEDETVFSDGVAKAYIDPRKTDGLLMFRLGEACNAIVVHERVKRSIEAHKIPRIIFYGPGEWAG